MRYKILFLLAILTGCNSSLPSYTVKITNLSENSGGSGSIVNTSAIGSRILTNAHVCQVVKNGGFVHDSKGEKHYVVSYITSNNHDLCIITVAANLGKAATLSDTAPVDFELAEVAGHPRLLPTILSKGHFSGKLVVQVMTGLRDCTEQEKQDPVAGMFCAILGKLPEVKTYESIVVSSLIQPGSSGSAVYGSAGKIAAVIFAGAGDLGYGLAVPYEYVADFLLNESQTLPSRSPSSLVNLSSSSIESTKRWRDQVKVLCSFTTDPQAIDFCSTLTNVSKFNDLIER